MRYIQKITPCEVINFRDQIEIKKDQMNSKTLVQRKELGLTLFALDKGQEIAEHSSVGDALVHVLSGCVEITISGEKYRLLEGESILMPANIPHALKAIEAFQMILTVVKPKVGDE